MTKPKSLLDGIGNQNVTEKYYDDWATNYDITLKKWKYEAPLKAVSVLLNIRKKFDCCLDFVECFELKVHSSVRESSQGQVLY